MATKKKTTPKKISQKVRAIVQADVFKSVAVASVLLNVLFVITIVVLTSSSTFDHKLYTSARERYCSSSESFKNRAQELGDKNVAARERQVDCIGKDFRPFYNEALEKYNAQSTAN